MGVREAGWGPGVMGVREAGAGLGVVGVREAGVGPGVVSARGVVWGVGAVQAQREACGAVPRQPEVGGWGSRVCRGRVGTRCAGRGPCNLVTWSPRPPAPPQLRARAPPRPPHGLRSCGSRPVGPAWGPLLEGEGLPPALGEGVGSRPLC